MVATTSILLGAVLVASPQKDTLAEALRVTADADCSFVRGTPLVVRVTAECIASLPAEWKTTEDFLAQPIAVQKEWSRRYHLTHIHVPTADPFILRPAPISVVINGGAATGGTEGPVDTLAFRLQAPRLVVSPSTPQTWFVDIGPLLKHVDDGVASVRVRLHAAKKYFWESDELSIEVRSATDEEKAVLERIGLRLWTSHSKEDLVEWRPDQSDLDLLVSGVGHDIVAALRPWEYRGRALRALAATPATPAELEGLLPSRADFPLHQWGLERLLWSDALQRHSFKEESDIILQELIEVAPSLTWYADEVRRGRGPLRRPQPPSTMIDRDD